MSEVLGLELETQPLMLEMLEVARVKLTGQVLPRKVTPEFATAEAAVTVGTDPVKTKESAVLPILE